MKSAAEWTKLYLASNPSTPNFFFDFLPKAAALAYIFFMNQRLLRSLWTNIHQKDVKGTKKKLLGVETFWWIFCKRSSLWFMNHTTSNFFEDANFLVLFFFAKGCCACVFCIISTKFYFFIFAMEGPLKTWIFVYFSYISAWKINVDIGPISFSKIGWKFHPQQ